MVKKGLSEHSSKSFTYYKCSPCYFKIGPNHAPVTLADVDSQELEAYCLFQTTHESSVERKGTGECLNTMAGISQ